MKHADTRLRIHLWPSHHSGWAWSIGPCGRQEDWGSETAGTALDRALKAVAGSLANGAVVIVEVGQ